MTQHWRDCIDCEVRTDYAGEWYIISESLWKSAVPEDYDEDGEYVGGICLCIGCLESRLGRNLAKEDFTDCFVNTEEAPRSARLLDRMAKTAACPYCGVWHFDKCKYKEVSMNNEPAPLEYPKLFLSLPT